MWQRLPRGKSGAKKKGQGPRHRRGPRPEREAQSTAQGRGGPVADRPAGASHDMDLHRGVTRQGAARPPHRPSPLLGHRPPAQTLLPSFPAATRNTQQTKQGWQWKMERPPCRLALGTPLVPSNWNDVPDAQLPVTQTRHGEDCGAAARKEPGSLRPQEAETPPPSQATPLKVL